MTLRLLERLEPRQLLRRDRRPRREPGRRQARLPVPARGQRRRPRTLVVPRRRGDCSTASTATGCRTGPGIGWTVVRSGRPMNVDDYGAYPSPAGGLDAADVRRGVRGAADLGRRGAGHDRARVRRRSPAVQRPRARGAVAVRPAGVDRPRQRPPVRACADRGPAARPRRPPRHAHGPAQPDGPAEPDDRAPRTPPRRPTARRQRSAGRADPARPRPVQGGQREPRARRRRPAARRGRAAARRRPPARPTSSPASAATSSACCSVRCAACARRSGSPPGSPPPSPCRSTSTARRSPSAPASAWRSAGASTTYAGDLLKEAEIALHRAKLDPVRKFVMFDPEMRAETLDRATLEHDLRRAIERSELRVHYQPLVDLDDRHASWASRRCSAGSTRPAASCRRCRSSRSPRRPA